MVILHATGSTFLTLADRSTSTGLERLDPETRAIAIMALLGLVLLGVTLVACVMIGGRWVRRLARQSPHSTASRRRSPFASTATVAASRNGALSGDTLTGEQRTDETRAD